MSTTQNQRKWVTQFSIIMAGQVFSLLGSGLVQFSIVWWLTKQTGSAVVLSIAMIMGVLPVILFSPFAGVVADRFNRKNVMMVADTFIALATIIMAALFTFGILEIWMIYVLLFLRALGTAFHQPAFESVMPLIAPPRHLVRVAAIIQMLRSGVNLLAPMLAAALVTMNVELPSILLIDVATAVIAVLTLAAIPIPDVQQSTDHHASIHGYFQDFLSGLRYVYQWKGLLALIIIFGFSNFVLAPILALMPLIVANNFQGGPLDYSFFEIAYAVGILAGGLLLSLWGIRQRKIVVINFSQIVSGLALASIALVPSDHYYLVLLAATICGIASAYINSPATAIIQTIVEKDMQGRVMSIITMVCMIAMPASLVIAGPLASIIEPITLIWLPGLISALVGAICFFIPPLMRIEDRPAANHPGVPDQVIVKAAKAKDV